MKKTELKLPQELYKMLNKYSEHDVESCRETFDYIDKLHSRIRDLELQLLNFEATLKNL